MTVSGECEHLVGRLRDICMGISGLPRDTENKYRALPQFGSLGPLPDNVPQSRPDHKNRGGRTKVSRNGGKPAEKTWDVTQPSRGLGDTVKKITHAIGIDKAVEKVFGTKGCGCAKRQSKLNELVPYSGG